MKKLAIITTHPIQYYAPLFQLLSKKVELKVFYTWGTRSVKKEDPGFGKTIEWDIPLLEGYEYAFQTNTATQPGSHHFNGIINPGLINQVKQFGPAAVFIFGWSYHSHLQVMRYFKGKVPIWFRGDSTLLDNKPGGKGVIKSNARRLFLKWVYRHIDLAFYVGNANKAYYEWIGLKQEQLVFAPHAIDNARFAVSRKKEVEEMRVELGIPASAIILLFAGKFEPKKNPLLLLHAFEQAANDDQHLIMVGNGILEKEIRETILTMHKKQQVHVLGFQNQQMMPVLYQLATIFCLPSSGPGETWGLAVNEAMAAGCSILASDKVGCYEDLVRENINGHVLPANNIGLWANAIAQATDKNRLAEQGENSKEMVMAYSYAKIKEVIVKQLDVL